MFFSRKLKKIKNLNHCFFSRKNGFSKGIYKSLNCGRGSKDYKKNIINNLNFVALKLKVKKEKLILMHQTHSAKVVEIKKDNLKKKIIADAMVTKMKGVALGVVTADCVPIILYDIKNDIIGCIHAGWKGAFSDIIKKTIFKFKNLNSNNKIYASIGPCIGKKSYEVDFQFYKKFVKKSLKNKKYFSKKNKHKKLFNLRRFVADKLYELEVKFDHVNHDTFREKTNFFSYRRSCKLKHNDYGRCISAVSLK
tara:strand:- start:95 stop:847 length:753 start_codon:yes stop_codon:yes gene_type:complete